MCGPPTVLLACLKRRRPESEIAGESRVVTKTKSGKSAAGETKKTNDTKIAQNLLDQIAEIDRIFWETKKA